MRRKQLLDRVSERLGPANPVDPARVVKTVAWNLSAALGREGARSLAEALPADLAPAPGGLHAEALEAHELFVRVAQQLQVELSHAAEYVTVAAQLLAETVGPATAERLRRDLPDSLARLLHPTLSSIEPPIHLHRSAHTLAEAEPAHPLYADRPTTVQSASVAAEPNPHSDIKLSSAIGMTQERSGRTIATVGPHKK